MSHSSVRGSICPSPQNAVLVDSAVDVCDGPVVVSEPLVDDESPRVVEVGSVVDDSSVVDAVESAVDVEVDPSDVDPLRVGVNSAGHPSDPPASNSTRTRART